MLQFSILLMLIPFLVVADPLPDGMFQVPVGGSVLLEMAGNTLAFDVVEEDSRCPANAYCFWEGNAACRFRMIQPAGGDEAFVLNTAWDFVRTWQGGGWLITLVGLNPYPADFEIPIDPDSYVAFVTAEYLGVVDSEVQPWGSIKALYR